MSTNFLKTLNRGALPKMALNSFTHNAKQNSLRGTRNCCKFTEVDRSQPVAPDMAGVSNQRDVQ